jgi:hypothetical protein
MLWSSPTQLWISNFLLEKSCGLQTPSWDKSKSSSIRKYNLENKFVLHMYLSGRHNAQHRMTILLEKVLMQWSIWNVCLLYIYDDRGNLYYYSYGILEAWIFLGKYLFPNRILFFILFIFYFPFVYTKGKSNLCFQQRVKNSSFYVQNI